MRNRLMFIAGLAVLAGGFTILAAAIFLVLQPDVVTVIHNAASSTPAYDTYQHSRNDSLPLVIGAGLLAGIAVIIAWCIASEMRE